MPIVVQGTINPASAGIPNVIVQVTPPQPVFTGVPTDVIGVVGTAVWGPVNSPFQGSQQDVLRIFGNNRPVKYDLSTAVSTASLQGASNYIAVRVTNGNDAAASVDLFDVTDPTPVDGAKITSIYSGTLGNTASVIVGVGSNSTTLAPTYRITITMTGFAPEVFDNIGGSGAALWQNIVNAINLGQSGVRGPSALVIASLGVATLAPALGSSNLTGGDDGNTGITDATLIGQDGPVARTGMYALRNTDASVGVLTDVTDITTFPTQVAFGISEGVYMIVSGSPGEQDTIAPVVSGKRNGGIDSVAMKYMLGDYSSWLDPVSGQTRLLPTQPFVAGRIASLSPEDSSLNKPIFGIIATQLSQENRVYSDAELLQLAEGGIDVVTNPVPGGNFFGVRLGINTSSNKAINGDNYPRLTFFLAKSFKRFLGEFIGVPATQDAQLRINSALQVFLASLEAQNVIGDSRGGPAYQISIDNSNIATGTLIVNIKVVYLSIITNFIVNLEGGQTVQVQFQPQI